SSKRNKCSPGTLRLRGPRKKKEQLLTFPRTKAFSSLLTPSKSVPNPNRTSSTRTKDERNLLGRCLLRKERGGGWGWGKACNQSTGEWSLRGGNAHTFVPFPHSFLSCCRLGLARIDP